MIAKRLERWVKASYGLARISERETTIKVLQGLGRLDCRLIFEDEQFLQLSQEEKETIEVSIAWSDRFTLSYLWVLGAYELVRTLDQLHRRGRFLLSDELSSAVREFKHDIGRLRMPLAKMEPANKYPNDESIAWPATHPQHGIAWQVAPETYISRRQLSDDLLDLVEAIRSYKFSK